MTEIISFGNENASFCEDCSKIWSACLTLPLNKPQKVCRFNQALRRSSCPSCSFFVDAFDKHLSLSSNHCHQCVACKRFKVAFDKRYSSNQSSLSCAEFLRSGTEWCPNDIWCWLGRFEGNSFDYVPYDEQSGQLDRISIKVGADQPQTRARWFDLIQFNSEDKAHSARPKAARVLLQPKIDVRKLKTWIRLSDELREPHDKLSISSSAESVVVFWKVQTPGCHVKNCQVIRPKGSSTLRGTLLRLGPEYAKIFKRHITVLYTGSTGRFYGCSERDHS